MGRTILAHLGRFTDGMLPLLSGAVPDAEFVPTGDPSASSDVLVALLDDREGARGVEQAITPDVRWIHVLGAGVDRFPLSAVGDRILTCSRGAAAPAIAEFVLASMLAFEKKLPDIWIHEPPKYWGAAGLGFMGGRTVGTIGFGAIGREVARRGLAFDMHVIAHRRTDTPSPIAGVRVVGSLHELLGTSDHVVVAAPATSATRHILDAEAFAAIRPGAHLVNIARGELIDQDALLRALDDHRVALASLDVVEPEPLPAGHPLYAHPKVRLTPHISWSSPETIIRTIALFAENLRRYDNGETLDGLVDVEVEY